MRSLYLCFDLDGTLVDENGRIHPNDKNILTAEKPSIVFVACTGRSLDSVKSTFSQNGLFSNKKIPFPLVLLNGTLIYGKDEELLVFNSFSNDEQLNLIKASKGFKEITFLYLTKDNSYVSGESDFGLEMIRKYEFSPLPIDTWSSNSPFSKVMCISNNGEQLRAFENILRNNNSNLEMAYSMPTIFEITPAGCNKGDGVRRLLSTSSHNKPLVHAAGDGENDLSLISVADNFFVPSTAPLQIRNRATRIVDISLEGLFKQMLQESLDQV